MVGDVKPQFLGADVCRRHEKGSGGQNRCLSLGRREFVCYQVFKINANSNLFLNLI